MVCLFAMQGDTQIRFFEVTEESPYVHFLNMYQSTVPGRSVCAMPKRHMDYMKCEVMRFFKLQHTKQLVEPISMTVPRKVCVHLLTWHLTACCILCLQSEMFQEDIFPDCPAGKAALSAEEWASGVDKDPILMKINGAAGASATEKVCGRGGERICVAVGVWCTDQDIGCEEEADSESNWSCE